MARALTGAAVAALSLVALSGAAAAQAVDGANIPSDFAGSLVATQATGTGFGDDTNPSQGFGGGSELNRLFVEPDLGAGLLRIGITGNLEAADNSLGGNGLTVYLDHRPGGENTLDLNGGFAPFGYRYVPAMVGTTFDAGFFPDLGISVNASGPGFFEYFVDTVDLHTNQPRYIGAGLFGSGSGALVGGVNPTGWLAAFDNSNTQGVGAFSGGADAGAPSATAGLEIAVPLADLGLGPGDTLGVQVLISGGNDPGFLSNQNLPPLPAGTANLGFAPVDYGLIPGEQHARVAIPAPSAALPLALGALLAPRRRVGPAR